jgi:hypothetical protein
MTKAIETHHISYDPEITTRIPHKEHQRIHNSLPIENTKLGLVMRKYDGVTTMIAAMKNWLISFEKDFGERPDIHLVEMEKLKREIRCEIFDLLVEQKKRVKHIRGLGGACLGGILGYANPERFSTLQRFLMYCGFKGRGNPKYSRRAKYAVYRTVKQIIKHKDSYYYPLYKEIKSSLEEKYPNWKIKTSRMAENRTGTLLLKEIYSIFCRKKNEED